MRKSKLFLVVLVLLTTSLHAGPSQDCSPDGIEGQAKDLLAIAGKIKEQDCPNFESVRNLCAQVSSKLKEDENSDEYSYRFSIYKGACADPDKEDEKIVKQKVKAMWDRYSDQLTCDSLQFNASGNSVIKFAVAKKFDTFIDDVISWGIDLNKVDQKDKMTVLQYIIKQKEDAKGTPMYDKLEEYEVKFKAAGAR